MERGAPGIALVSDVYSSSPGPCLCTCCFCALVGNGKVTLLEEPIHVVPCRHVAFNQQDLGGSVNFLAQENRDIIVPWPKSLHNIENVAESCFSCDIDIE